MVTDAGVTLALIQSGQHGEYRHDGRYRLASFQITFDPSAVQDRNRGVVCHYAIESRPKVNAIPSSAVEIPIPAAN
uniref:Uncharacterized protein n=1 Tax=mine drainage metagenome TaxID=410659 RepID=E6QIE3_9ZZZZ